MSSTVASFRRPRIGIPTRVRTTGDGVTADEIRTAYSRAILAAGGLPVLLPSAVGLGLMEVVAELDGVLLAGGSDLEPCHFGEPAHPHLGEVDPPRDGLELALAKHCLSRDLPVFGVCRGHQVLAVAGGGALWQDLPSQVSGVQPHERGEHDPHHVEVLPGTRLAAICGAGPLSTNSRHHQAAKTLGPGWIATAHSADGIVEGLELPGHRFALGVQWHPEDLQGFAPHVALFRTFVEACR